MFKPIGAIIGNRRFGKSSDAILALGVRRVAQEVINGLDLPNKVKATIKVKTFKNGVLTVGCPPLVAAELYMRFEELKKGMNGKLGGSSVGDLRFKVL